MACFKTTNSYLLLSGMVVQDQGAGLSLRKADILFSLAQTLSSERPYFFQIKGPSAGDLDTGEFMKELRARARSTFNVDYSEKRICGENKLCVVFYLEDEETIVEVALGLRNSLSEFERDVFKAIMAKESGKPVANLMFISKPGARRRLNQPGARSVMVWAERNHGIKIEVLELTPS